VTEPSAQRVTFYIQPRYKYRQVGQNIVYNDHVLFYNQKFNSYLHVSEDQSIEQVELKSDPSSFRPKSPVRKPNPDQCFKNYDTNMSETYYKWQVVSYRQVKNEKD
jgi:hypothetical protein